MINILIILLFLNVAFARRNVLYCGLFGWIGSSLEYFNSSKVNLLGYLNDDRGGDGFGIFVESFLAKSVFPGKFKEGIKKNKDFRSLTPKNIPLYLGHTRKKSTGKLDLEHTQPIVLESSTEEGHSANLKSCLLHNGTIDSPHALIKTVEADDVFDKIYDLSDTQVMANIFHYYRMEGLDMSKVLEAYEGAAAFIMHFSDEPEAIYIFKGKSKTYYGAAQAVEERPLYIVKEGDKGYYLSSIKESLEFISDSDEFEEVVDIPCNVLFRLTAANGLEEVIKVNREEKYKTYNNRNTNYDDYENTRFYAAETTKQSMSDINTLWSLTKKCKTLREVSTALDASNYLEVLNFLGKIYPFSSIITMATNLPEKKSNSGRVIFFRGRYLTLYSSPSSKLGYTGSLASGKMSLSDDGTIFWGKEVDLGTTYYFKDGIRIKPEATEFISKYIQGNSSSRVDSLYTLTTLEREKVSLTEIRELAQAAAEPFVLFYSTTGLMYSPSSGNTMASYNGKFTPLFFNKTYNLRGGAIIFTESLRKEREVPNKVSLVPAVINTPKVGIHAGNMKIVVLCPKCRGYAERCYSCNADGYIPLEKEEEVNTDPVDCEILSDIDKEVQTQINTEVIEVLKSLGGALQEARNSIVVIGEETDMVKGALDLLDKIEDEIVELSQK